MSDDTRTHVAALMTAMEGLGYSYADDAFDFDAVPTSKMNKAYRVSVGTAEIVEVSGNRVEKRKNVELWAAYRMTAKGDRKDAFLDILDSQEAVEDKVLTTIKTVPMEIADAPLVKYVQNYVVLNVSFRLTYWRDLT